MTQNLFKYKDGSEKSIKALLNDRLYVSSLAGMNDPLEFGFYVERDVDISRIREFQQWLLKEYSCISLSTTKISRRLWNYYTDGMQGMALEYSESTIKKALGAASISTVQYDLLVPKKNPKHEHVASMGRVKYDNKKTDLTKWYNMFIGRKDGTEFVSSEVLFHKDDSWEDEKEYRFVFLSEYLPNKYLEGLVPNAIYMGYRMKQDNESLILKYCKEKNIPLYRYTPDFYAKSSKLFYKETIFDPNGNPFKEGNVEITE